MFLVFDLNDFLEARAGAGGVDLFGFVLGGERRREGGRLQEGEGGGGREREVSSTPHSTFATFELEPLIFFRRDYIPRQRQRDCFPTMASVSKRGSAVVNLCWEESKPCSLGAKSTDRRRRARRKEGEDLLIGSLRQTVE